ncbi:hypothetical protein PDIDSM_4991 [Penicillium digitatum]|nr:hypothetical protein PDIDSM_4991 [Penicillium digitatum]
MSYSRKQEKTFDLVETLGLTPNQVEHLLLGLLCMEKCKVDWSKLADLCKVTPSSARTVFTKARRRLVKWEEKPATRVARQAKKGAEEAEEAEEAKEYEVDIKD